MGRLTRLPARRPLQSVPDRCIQLRHLALDFSARHPHIRICLSPPSCPFPATPQSVTPSFFTPARPLHSSLQLSLPPSSYAPRFALRTLPLLVLTRRCSPFPAHLFHRAPPTISVRRYCAYFHDPFFSNISSPLLRCMFWHLYLVHS